MEGVFSYATTRKGEVLERRVFDTIGSFQQGKFMEKMAWRDGIEEKIEALCAIFPPVIKTRWKERLFTNAERIALCEGVPRVTEEIFWRSVYEVFPGGYEPLILQVKDPERLKADMVSSRNQESMGPGTEPVKIVRWSKDPDIAAPVPEGKRIVAVSASARKGGNTDVLVDEILRACGDRGSIVEKIYLADLTIEQCTGCRACRKKDVKTICAIRDDMTPLYDKLYQMDGLVAGFPIYTARENGIMATFMDRWDCLSNPYLTRKMPGMKKALMVCAWMWPNSTAYDNVVENMVILFRLHKVVTTDVLTLSGTRGKGHGKGVVKNHPDILKTAYDAGIQFLKNL